MDLFWHSPGLTQWILSWRLLAFCFLLFRGVFITEIEASPSDGGHQMDAEMAKFKKLRVMPESYDKLKRTHENLYYGAVKALMGQLGKNMYKRLSKGEQRRLAKCLDRIENRFDLKSPAICLVESKRRLMETQRTKSDELLAFVQEEEKHQSDSHRVEVPFMRDSDGVTVEGTHKTNAGQKKQQIQSVQQRNGHLLGKVEKGRKRTESARLIRYGKKGRRRVPRRVDDGFEQLLKTRKEREKWLTNGRMGRWESAEEAQGNAEERFKVGVCK
ncbi:hypothetical protein niasHT_012108 [Heterodera trifolii]|uniref:Uncharacterized protein n=1 Tax=Heterodera trifolii TaxID=157864 RepID=A0ABD2LAD0_9BILA